MSPTTPSVSPLSASQSQAQSQAQLRAQQAEEARARWAPLLDRELQRPVYEPEQEHLYLTVLVSTADRYYVH